MAEQLSPAERKVLNRRSVAEDVQILLAGDNYQQMWDVTENLSVINANKMVAAMLKKIGSREQFAIDLGALLKAYIINKMDVEKAKESDPGLATLFTRYDIRESGALTEDTVTLPRLSMTFPYESAVIRSVHYGPSKLLPPIPYRPYYPNCECFGENHVGTYEVLMFPFAGFIIPSSWDKLWQYWTNWYRNFIECKLAGPLPLPLEIRLQTQIEAMKERAVENNDQNIIKMGSLYLSNL